MNKRSVCVAMALFCMLVTVARALIGDYPLVSAIGAFCWIICAIMFDE